ncbi:MAG: SCO family protein, partial [Rhodocyclaceae bacterium]|nr:SCO family protein [Rhodocyclaceae bacterium]
MPPSQNLSATLLRDEKPLPAFDFERAGGRFTNGDLTGRWTFLFFGYTQCPDICPTALALMAQVKAGIVEAKGAEPQVAFVSVDPKRDTPALLARYVPHFDPAFIGAVGDDT